MTSTLPTQKLDIDNSLRRYRDVRDLMPSPDNPSPLVRLNRVWPAAKYETFLKLEWFNPFGSLKDRTASYLLAGLDRRGELGGREIVEASSGNTAIALAALASLQDSKVLVTVPDGVPEEKKVILRMLGAEVWETPDDLCPVDHPKDGAIALARSLVASGDRARYVGTEQYENEDNTLAHYETTGPEIWAQTEGRVRWFFAGFGTTGTLTGVGRFLKERDPSIRVVGVEPQPGHRLPGLKSFQEANIPALYDASVVDESVVVPDVDAYQVTRDLWREESLMVGPSTGAVVHAISQVGPEQGDVIVAISADSGTAYTSYFEEVLGDEGKPTI